jgi:hypothetical protein
MLVKLSPHNLNLNMLQIFTFHALESILLLKLSNPSLLRSRGYGISLNEKA